MARSASRWGAGGPGRPGGRRRAAGWALAGLGSAAALAGCTTTQQTAQRVQLDSARQRAALEPTRVIAPNRLVVPVAVAVVRAGGRSAFVVTVRNRGRRAVSDLPISVGYAQAHGTSVLLNAGTGLGYFQAHLPAIRAGGKLTWVYTSQHALPAGARPFARVGRRPAAPARLTEP
ncbi:MAG: hypothetical protein KGL16_00160, partial [Acidobacteriota bacterium]|nr:hypothetical protein [Acidobacteriota bacterium]